MVTREGDGGEMSLFWHGPTDAVAWDVNDIHEVLRQLDRACFVVAGPRGLGVTDAGIVDDDKADGLPIAAIAPPLTFESLGDPAFLRTYGLRVPYMAGAMANAIASESMVLALGKAGMLGSFGAGGLSLQRLGEAIRQIQAGLPEGPYAFNLIHSPHEPAIEEGAVSLYLQHGVRVVEASAYLKLTPAIVRYRAAGLSLGPEGEIVIKNRIIAKLSRHEVAEHFLRPAPPRLLQALVASGAITSEQATLAERVPMADDITVEADSGGHTDNRPLVCLLPAMIAQRDAVQEEMGYPEPVRIGAAGGIGTALAALGAFMMGAAYVVTGSVNHGCVEAGTSDHVKRLLAEADMADVMMAPAADMFELGVNLQVLKRGTLFPLRARKLYELYSAYPSLDALPPTERQKLERQIFRRSLDEVWDACVNFFSERDPRQLERAQRDPKRKMALVFRWYLGLATRWAVTGEAGRELDYQIWCGPAMGAFNTWVRGTYLEAPQERHVADVAFQIMGGALYHYRLHYLRSQGVQLPAALFKWKPRPTLDGGARGA